MFFADKSYNFTICLHFENKNKWTFLKDNSRFRQRIIHYNLIFFNKFLFSGCSRSSELRKKYSNALIDNVLIGSIICTFLSITHLSNYILHLWHLICGIEQVSVFNPIQPWLCELRKSSVSSIFFTFYPVFFCRVFHSQKFIFY